jgi:hypothetical protein
VGKAKTVGIDWQLLRDPFPEDDVRWRVQQAGNSNGQLWATVLAYLTNRAIQARLDEVVGPDRWCNEYKPGPQGGVICGISISVDGGEWVTKWDGADPTDVEAVKGGLSDAMKRAAVQWGIGRYLYQLGIGQARIVSRDTPGARTSRTPDKKYFHWLPPVLPAWALPPERVDEKYIASMCGPAAGFDCEGIIKLVVVIAGDESVNAATRDSAKARLRELYREKREQANGKREADAGGAGCAGPANAGGTAGLLPEQAAAAAGPGANV